MRMAEWREALRKAKTAKERTSIPRVKMPELAADYRVTCNEEVNQGLTIEMAMADNIGKGGNNIAADMMSVQMGMTMGQQMMNNINNGNSQATSTAAGTYKFCPNCGTPVNGAKFCSNCGTKLS